MVLDAELTAVLVVEVMVEDGGAAEELVLVVALTGLEEDERVAELVEIGVVVEGRVDDELDVLDVLDAGVGGGAESR